MVTGRELWITGRVVSVSRPADAWWLGVVVVRPGGGKPPVEAQFIAEGWEPRWCQDWAPEYWGPGGSRTYHYDEGRVLSEQEEAVAEQASWLRKGEWVALRCRRWRSKEYGPGRRSYARLQIVDVVRGRHAWEDRLLDDLAAGYEVGLW